MREIRMLRTMWRVLETGLRTTLAGHEGGNPGHRQGLVLPSYRASARPYQASMVVIHIQPHDVAQMALIQNDDVVETLSTDGADDSLDVG